MIFRYLLVPFYMGDIFGRMMDDRKKTLSMQKHYYDEFIKLCNHYELVTKEVRKKERMGVFVNYTSLRWGAYVNSNSNGTIMKCL